MTVEKRQRASHNIAYYTVIPKRVVHYGSGAGLTGCASILCQKSRRPSRARELGGGRLARVHISPVPNKSPPPPPPLGLCGGTRSLGQFISCFRLSYRYLSLTLAPRFHPFSLSPFVRIYIFDLLLYTTITPSSLSIYNDELSVR